MALNDNSFFPMMTNPVTMRAAAVLPAAGAWDVAPTIIAAPNAKYVTLFLTYTRGAAGGAMDIQILASPYAANPPVVESWFTQVAKSTGAVAAGVDTQSRVQREYITYGAGAAAAESFIYGPVGIEYIERIQVRCRESGVVGTPGTAHIVAMFWS